MFKRVAFTMYPVENMQRARNFYEKILGFDTGNAMADGAWVEYDMPSGGCFAITMAQGVTPSADSGGSIAFEVDDVEQLMAQLKDKGVTVKMDIFNSPVCKMAAQTATRVKTCAKAINTW